MEKVTENFLRDQLLERRHRLEAVMPGSEEHVQLTQLLREVDTALTRMNDGSFGICESCHEPIEKDRVIADPLVRYCLDHLTPDQQRTLEQDLELAAQMQRGLLPEQGPRRDGWEIHYHYAPLGPVSGDYCDVIAPEKDAGDLFLALGDAAGKGVAASMLMTHLHAIFRTLSASRLPAHQMLERAGRVFRESMMSPYYATLVCGWARANGEIEFANAGHCPPVLLRGGRATAVHGGGLPLGMFSEGQYTIQNVKLDRGDSLFLYTDGLSEARSSTGEEFGERRVIEAAIRNHSLASGRFIEAIRKALEDFRHGEPALDDLTMMIVRRVA